MNRLQFLLGGRYLFTATYLYRPKSTFVSISSDFNEFSAFSFIFPRQVFDKVELRRICLQVTRQYFYAVVTPYRSENIVIVDTPPKKYLQVVS